MAERGEPWPADEDVVAGRTTLISQRALVVSSLFVALAAGVAVAKALPVPDTAMQRVAWWLVAETAALAAVSAMQLLVRRRRWAAALAPAGLALVIVLTAVAVIIAAPAPERARDLVVTLGADTEIGLSPDATVAVEAAAVFAAVPVTDPPAPTTVVVAVLPTEPPTTAAEPTSVVGAVIPSQAVPTVPTEPPTAPATTAPPATEPPTTSPTTTATPTTAPATTAPPTTTVAVSADVLVSLSADRSAPVAAKGATVARGSDIYVFVDPAAAITRVRFWFGSKKGLPDHVETSAPFDLAGTASDGTANPYTVADFTGFFSITAEVTFVDGSISTTKVTLQRV